MEVVADSMAAASAADTVAVGRVELAVALAASAADKQAAVAAGNPPAVGHMAVEVQAASPAVRIVGSDMQAFVVAAEVVVRPLSLLQSVVQLAEFRL